MSNNRTSYLHKALFCATIAGSLTAPTHVQAEIAQLPQARSNSHLILIKASAHPAADLPPHAKAFYMATLGVDSLVLKAVESGLMIRFSYRVINAGKAALLHDKKINPYLVDEHTHRALVVPTLEKVGEMRQSGTVETGKVYWMLFSNKGNFVKRGSRVSVVIGKAHIDGLIVE